MGQPGRVYPEILLRSGKKLKENTIPELKNVSFLVDTELVHEAAIGRIAGEQLTRLMSLGLTAAEAEEQMINGFLQ